MDRKLKEDLDIFEKKLATLINECSLESTSDTPDFILASYLRNCLEVYRESSLKREKWYGRPIKIDKKKMTGLPQECYSREK